MVKVRETYSLAPNGQVDIPCWLEEIQRRVPLENPDQLRRACELSLSSDQKAVREDRLWARGASSFQTGLEMVQILVDLHLDQSSLGAAVLYRAVREGAPLLVSPESARDTYDVLDRIKKGSGF